MAPKMRDLTGHTQGRLTVVSLARRERERNVKGWLYYWLCACECGNTLEAEAGKLQRAKPELTSCGCAKKDLYDSPEWKRKNTKPGAAFRTVLRQYQQNAKNRSIPWELSEEEFRVFTLSPCHYTGFPPQTLRKVKSGEEYIYNGVDRVDNSKGYTPENCVACCTEINLMKLDMTKERFVELCSKVSERFPNVFANN